MVESSPNFGLASFGRENGSLKLILRRIYVDVNSVTLVCIQKVGQPGRPRHITICFSCDPSSIMQSNYI
jgi:hypothetical protein